MNSPFRPYPVGRQGRLRGKPNVSGLERILTLESRTSARKSRLAINGELFLPLDWLVQCEAAVGTLDVAQRISGNSYARTTPRTRLRLSANPQRAMASGTSYAAERQQHYDDGDRERGVERQPWNPCHSLEDYRRDQASKEQRHNYTPDDSVSLTKVFAHSFHGARFYSLWSAAQCSRQPEREARLDPKPSFVNVRFAAPHLAIRSYQMLRPAFASLPDAAVWLDLATRRQWAEKICKRANLPVARDLELSLDDHLSAPTVQYG